MRLMRIESTKKDEWEALKQALVEFGKSFGIIPEHRNSKLLADPWEPHSN